MYSSGMTGVAAGIFAVQFAPDMQLFGGMPSWLLGVLVVASVYLFTFWRSMAMSSRRHQ